MPPDAPPAGTPRACSPQACEQLDAIVTRAFGIEDGFQELNGVVLAATEHNLYDELGDGTGPMKLVVPELRTLMIQTGQAEPCLAALFRYLNGNFELRQWARQHRADLLPLVSEDDFAAARQAYDDDRQLRRIGAVGAGIAKVGETMRLSPEMLKLPKQMIAQLDELSGYKGMHDILHKLQIEVLGELDKIFATDIDEGDRSLQIILLVQELDLARSKAAGFFARHGGLRALDSPHSALLPQLDEALKLLGDSTADAASARARGRFRLRSLLRQHMPSLDDQLVQSASEIPFVAFATMLRSLARPAAGAPPPEATGTTLVNAADALCEIDHRLVWRREIHQIWQQVDAKLWQVEEVLRGAGISEELLFLWEDVGRLTSEINLKHPDRGVDELAKFAESIDAAAAAGFAPLTTTLKLAFSRYSRAARMEFLKTDSELLRDCEKLNDLKEPLKMLMGD